jgi:hypothetical protein
MTDCAYIVLVDPGIPPHGYVTVTVTCPPSFNTPDSTAAVVHRPLELTVRIAAFELAHVKLKAGLTTFPLTS